MANFKRMYEYEERGELDLYWVEQAEGYLERKELLEPYKTELRRYFEYKQTTHIRPKSLLNINQMLVPFFIELGKVMILKSINEITREDINKAMFQKQKSGLSQATIVSISMQLRGLFKWYFEEKGIEWKGKFPHAVDHLNTRLKRQRIQPADLLTEEEIKKIINACTKKRDRAIVATLWSSGCRVGELINIKIRDLTFPIESHLKYVDVKLSGKTGERTVTIIEAYPYLLDWLNEHPLAGNSEASLFMNQSNSHYGKKLLYQGIVSILRVAARRAGVGSWGEVELVSGKRGYKHKSGKNVHPHLFRKSRATFLATHKNWTEPLLRPQFGWTASSSTPSIYCLAGQQEVKQRMLQESGIETKKIPENILKPRECPICSEICPATAIACHCGAVLSSLDAEKIKRLKNETNSFMDKIKDLPLRPQLIQEGTKNEDYLKELVKTDPWLKEQFVTIAKEILASTQQDKGLEAKRQEFFNKPRVNEIGRPAPVRDANTERVKVLREIGWSMEKIVKETGVGYGSVNKICQQLGLNKNKKQLLV